MNKFFRSRMIRSLLPYFIFGITMIIAFRLISEIGFFTHHIGRFWAVIAPFLTGAIFAYILNIPCDAIQRLYMKINNGIVQKFSRPISVLTLVVIIVMLIVLALNIMIPAISDSINEFVNDFERYEETFRGWMETMEEWDLPDFLPDINEDEILGMVQNFMQDFEPENLFAFIIAWMGDMAMAVFRTFLAIVTSIYLLIEKDRLKAFVLRLIEAVTSAKTNESILKYSNKLNFNFRQYIYTQTIDGIILGSMMFVVLFLFGSDYALVLALILGILNYIPYFGSIVGTAIAVLVIAFTQGIPTAALAAVIMFIIQQLDGNVIQPKLMGESFKLSPLLVIISVTVGWAYGGVLGMLVAIPLVAIFKDLVDDYIAYREKKKRENPPPIQDTSFMDREIW